MSNTDNIDPAKSIEELNATESAGPSKPPEASAGEAAAGSDELVCQAEDLKGLLQQIAHQISDADKRHGDALQAMQQRLAAIGDRAEQVKTNVPEEFRPAFERIEDAVSLLGERIAVAASERHTRQEPAAPQESVAPQQGQPQAETQTESQAEPSGNMDAAANEQFERELAALKETVLVASGQAPADVEAALDEETQSNAQEAIPGVDADSDPVQAAAQPDMAMPVSIAADPTQPWDADSVEALVQLYDDGPEGLPPPPVAAMPAGTTAPLAVPAADAALGLAHASINEASISEEWLEEKFADMAARVEMSLADIKPDFSMDVLGERFDRLEAHLGNAFDDVVTRNDVAGLSSIEQQLTELSGHLEQTQGQLTRLDGIEDSLGDIISQITMSQDTERQGLGGEAEFTALAETVAIRVARSITDGQKSDDTQGRFDDLRTMLSSYMNERREGEKNTSGALDTMQEALIHLVERVDAMENKAAPALAMPVANTAAAAAAAGDATELPRVEAPRVEAQEYVREAVRFKVDNGAQPDALYKGPEHMHSGAGATTPIEAAADDARRMAQSAAAAAAAHQPPRGSLGGSIGDELSLPGSRVQPGLAGAGAPQPRVSQVASSQAAEPAGPEGKADFIEQARRAQRLAGEAMEQQEQGLEQKGGSGGSLKSRIAMVGRKAGSNGAGSKTKSKGLPRSLLVACAALAVVTMGTLLYGKMSGDTRPALKIEKKFVKPQNDKAAMTLQNGKSMNSAAQAHSAMNSNSAGSMAGSTPAGSLTRSGQAGSAMSGGSQQKAPLKDSRLLNGQIPGIAVHNTRSALSAAALAQIDQRKAMARASSKISMRDELALTATNASLQPRKDVTVSALDPARQASSSRALDMPPALIGPLSLRLAAAKGDPSAEFEIAARFAEGKGVSQDFGAASNWYQRSASRGFAPAQYRLGTLYERGLGVSNDMSRARIWYLRAAKQGNVKAMHNLAVLSAGRVGTTPDYATAVQWFTEAGERGLADSQFNLGILYETGLGVARDPVNSYKWFWLAAARGDKQAARRRDTLRSKLSPAQLASAERKVRGWHQTPVENLVNDPRAAGQAWLGHGAGKSAG